VTNDEEFKFSRCRAQDGVIVYKTIGYVSVIYDETKPPGERAYRSKIPRSMYVATADVSVLASSFIGVM